VKNVGIATVGSAILIVAAGTVAHANGYGYGTKYGTATGLTSGSHQGTKTRAQKQIVATEMSGQYGFVRSKATVKIGTKVTWLNSSNAPHTVTASSSNWKFSSKQFTQGMKVTFTFRKAGTYKYFCSIHPYMKGTIVVKS